MGSVNSVTLIGNLGRDAEVRYTPSGQAVANFSIATTEKWKSREGAPQERTEWHNCQLWGQMAETLTQYLTKGKQVYVLGRIQTNEYTDKEGQKRKATSIRVERVVLLGRAGEGGGAARPASHQPDASGSDFEGMPAEDDIPFNWLMPFIGATIAYHAAQAMLPLWA